MQDMQAYLRKLHLDAVDCALISKRATDPQKKELFDRLADHLAMLASELERAIEAKGPWWIISLVHAKPRPRPCGFTLPRIGGIMALCPPSPAAAILTPIKRRGSSITPTCTPARSGSGNPFGTDPWQWSCGFYPGSRPGECKNGTAASYEAARSAFSRRLARVSVEPNRG